MHFNAKNEREAREDILARVREYCDTYHKKGAWQEGDPIPYGGRVYGSEEMSALVDSSLEFFLTSGRYTARFEQELASYLGVRHCSFVNSGSSANLLALMALTSPLLGERRLCRGDEIITVAAAFPTTVSPIMQFGAVPVFVDVTLPQYNIDVNMLEQALSPKTKAVMLAHTLGNPFDLKAVRNFCNRYNLWLIEDNCDALGSLYDFDGTTYHTGAVGDISTVSFYPAHQMTTGEGGAVCTNDHLLSRIIRSMRDWGRDCVCPPGKDGVCGHRFEGKYGELPEGYDHKYGYSHFGYNLKATDMQAAIGCAQLQRLPAFVERRRANYSRLRAQLACVADKLMLPEACPGATPAWFGLPLTCLGGTSRDDVVTYLEKKGIQTRMLFSGNLIKHPCFDELRRTQSGYRVVGDLAVTDRIMRDTFWVGVYPGLSDEMIDHMAKILIEAVN
ncbi:MAG: lipopolysaccharide biosynthesis protein RfbH [Clostridia bacterium]|nr:lipopolysaccharide biosynthesis protein RfbH [Clostridia bacterium]